MAPARDTQSWTKLMWKAQHQSTRNLQ